MHKLLEIHGATATGVSYKHELCIKNRYEPLCQRIVGDRRHLQELVAVEGARSVAVELEKSLLEALDLLCGDLELVLGTYNACFAPYH